MSILTGDRVQLIHAYVIHEVDFTGTYTDNTPFIKTKCGIIRHPDWFVQVNYPTDCVKCRRKKEKKNMINKQWC